MAFEILVVDDQKDIRELVGNILEDEGYKVRSVGDGVAALQAVRSRCPHLIILDVWLNDQRFDGVNLLDIFTDRYPFLPIIMMSGHGNIEMAVNTLEKGAFTFIEKPFKLKRLTSVVSKGIQQYQLNRELMEAKQGRKNEETILGESAKISGVKQQIAAVSHSKSRILLTGAAGTGKELVARSIHRHSPRAHYPFVVVNCASISEESFDTVFFGEEGSVQRCLHVGCLEKANGGTLFLKNVGDLPLSLQGRLLSFLQKERFKYTGGQHDIQADIRIISSTSQDLQHSMENKRFREDLYYRLNVIPIHLPSVAQRREDILSIIYFFMEQLRHNYNARPKKLSLDAEIILQRYEWPGNIRQIKNVVEWLLIMYGQSDEMSIEADMLPQDILGGQILDAGHGKVGDLMDFSLREARERFESLYLNFHVLKHNGNVTKTARAIGMERTALHRKLKGLKL